MDRQPAGSRPAAILLSVGSLGGTWITLFNHHPNGARIFAAWFILAGVVVMLLGGIAETTSRGDSIWLPVIVICPLLAVPLYLFVGGYSLVAFPLRLMLGVGVSFLACTPFVVYIIRSIRADNARRRARNPRQH